jgi:hypothetical protein
MPKELLSKYLINTADNYKPFFGLPSGREIVPSIGETLYTFNEKWFIGRDKIINVFAFLMTPADKIGWDLKAGAYLPLNGFFKERT